MQPLTTSANACNPGTWKSGHTRMDTVGRRFLCALQPEQRELWAATWYDLIKEEGRLVCLIFPIDPDRQGGPPFAVTTGLYRNLLENVGAFWTAKLNLDSCTGLALSVSHSVCYSNVFKVETYEF